MYLKLKLDFSNILCGRVFSVYNDLLELSVLGNTNEYHSILSWRKKEKKTMSEYPLTWIYALPKTAFYNILLENMVTN